MAQDITQNLPVAVKLIQDNPEVAAAKLAAAGVRPNAVGGDPLQRTIESGATLGSPTVITGNTPGNPMSGFFEALQGVQAPPAPAAPQLPGAAPAPRGGQAFNPQLLEQIRQLLTGGAQPVQSPGSALGALALGQGR